ncbi:MAG: DUF3098 domain-containing protein [Flavobacteriaceae bacterium]
MESKKKKVFIFEKKNYRLLLVALGVIALGFVLMSGGGSEDPSVFNPEIFSFRRIRLAPSLVLVGFGIAVYSIFAKTNA